MMRCLKLSLVVCGLLALCACQDREIKTYRIAKEEKSERPKVPHDHDGDGVPDHEHHGDEPSTASAPALPAVKYELPAGWKEQKPDRMRAASILVNSEDGRMAEVAVIPLPATKDLEREGVNLSWRKQLQLPELSEEQLAKERQKVEVGSGSGNLYEMVAEGGAGTKLKTRLLGVVAPQDEIVWFIRMSGDDALVAEQKGNFTKFLKSLQFAAAPEGTKVAAEPISTNEKEVPATAAGSPKSKVPANWKEKPPGPMILTAYDVEAEGSKAEVTISKFPGDVGGQAANIDRWRRQLGLGSATAEETAKTVSSMEIEGKKAYVVDITGTRAGKPARMVAVGVPRIEETWFYKLLGDEAVVAKEKEPFLQFIKRAY